ncbi:MAG TPA: ATP-binding cassette domain-containing protein [Gemmatimonas sp.]|nr:ATP-binding cassette domain-containing protein [Gemmatimonas sp.]
MHSVHAPGDGDALRVTGISKRYAHHVAVSNLSLRVPRGSVFGLLGPNGAGKTSTIRMLLNIMAPDEGTIEVLGLPSGDPSLVDRLGYLPEERGLYRKMRVRDVLRFLGRLKSMPKSGLDAKIDAWLERFQLRGRGGEDWGKARVEELSRGMQQKVQFIGALLHDPELVVLDEPFSGLDPVNAQALKDTVAELRARGKTVIFSTHVMENAERMCDAVCIISRGEKVLDGPVREVRAQHGARIAVVVFESPPSEASRNVFDDPSLVARVNYGHELVEAELTTTADPQQLLVRLIDSGARLQRFEMVRPSLHRIFLEKVGAEGVEIGLSGHG